jgi:uncharacterized membrane protein YbhN (UPF0104 family)
MGEMTKEKRRGGILGWIVGIALLGSLLLIVHRSLGWGALLAPWAEVPPGILVLSVALVLGSYAIRTIRVHEYFYPVTRGAFPRSFRLILIHNLFNNLLPMRSGEASFPILMAREFGVPFSRSLPGLLFLRVLDLHFVLLLGLMVFSWGRGPLAWTLALAMIPVPLAAFAGQKWLSRHLQDRKGRGWVFLRDALEGLPATPEAFFRTWLWTGVNWTAKIMVLAWILRFFSPMPFLWAVLGSTTGELSSVLPFHGVAGAGTYEAGVLASLVPLGLEVEAALRGAINLHLFVLGTSIFSGALAFLLPLGRKAPDESARNS